MLTTAMYGDALNDFSGCDLGSMMCSPSWPLVRLATPRVIVMRIVPAILMLLAVAPARAETTMRYTVLFQGKPGGQQITRTADDGTITVDFSYRNNGRGPDL
jgi:hypothetical protein